MVKLHFLFVNGRQVGAEQGGRAARHMSCCDVQELDINRVDLLGYMYGPFQIRLHLEAPNAMRNNNCVPL